MCPYAGCFKLYTCPFNVNQHIREQHTNTRPYVCEICVAGGVGRGFNRAFGLNRHMKNVHHVPVNTTTGRRKTAIANEAAEVLAQGLTDHPAFQMAVTPSTNVTTPDEQYLFDFETEEQQTHGEYPVDTLPTPESLIHEDQTACVYCNQGFLGFSELRTHMHAAHDVSASPDCPCPTCVAAYSTHFVTASFRDESIVSSRSSSASPIPTFDSVFAPHHAVETYDFFDQFLEDEQATDPSLDPALINGEDIIDSPMFDLASNETDAHTENQLDQTSSTMSEHFEAGLQESEDMELDFEGFDFDVNASFFSGTFFDDLSTFSPETFLMG